MPLFSNPQKKLQKAYEAKLTEARDAQRNGKIQVYAELMEQAEVLRQKAEAAKAAK